MIYVLPGWFSLFITICEIEGGFTDICFLGLIPGIVLKSLSQNVLTKFQHGVYKAKWDIR